LLYGKEHAQILAVIQRQLYGLRLEKRSGVENAGMGRAFAYSVIQNGRASEIKTTVGQKECK
jgi:hypothetical protein